VYVGRFSADFEIFWGGFFPRGVKSGPLEHRSPDRREPTCDFGKWRSPTGENARAVRENGAASPRAGEWSSSWRRQTGSAGGIVADFAISFRLPALFRLAKAPCFPGVFDPRRIVPFGFSRRFRRFSWISQRRSLVFAAVSRFFMANCSLPPLPCDRLLNCPNAGRSTDRNPFHVRNLRGLPGDQRQRRTPSVSYYTYIYYAGSLQENSLRIVARLCGQRG